MTKRILIYVIGLILISFGISLVYVSNFGAGPFDATNRNLSYITPLSVGTWIIIINLLVCGVSYLLIKKAKVFIAMIPTLIIGPMVDFWMTFVLKYNATDKLAQISIYFLALLILSLAVDLVLISKLQPNAIDSLMMNIKNTFKVPLILAKIITEGSMFIIALITGLLSGNILNNIGWGTLLLVLLMGPLMDIILKILYKFGVKKI